MASHLYDVALMMKLIPLIQWLVLMASTAWANPICREALQTEVSAVAFEPSSEHQLPIDKLYVAGVARSGNLLFLTAAEYQQKVREQAIPVDAILVLSELPLIEDLPLVAGIIVSQPLSMEATHVQLLAEKLGIPMALSQRAHKDVKLLKMATQFQSFDLNCAVAGCRIIGRNEVYVPASRMKSVLPPSADRKERALFTKDHILEFSPRHLSGDKYYSLMEFKRSFPDLVPDISSLSSGYFEAFMDTYVSQGESLRYLYWELLRQLELAQQANDELLVKKLLENFRTAILDSQPNRRINSNLFEHIENELGFYYGAKDRPFSFRSNNDVEDLLATGLYKSTVIKKLNASAIEQGLKKIWVSLFEYRAYSIRRYWGQRDENLSMPVMIHPYIDQVLGHAVGTFKYSTQRDLEFSINLVFGNTDKATNPSETAQVLQMLISLDAEKKPRLQILNARANGGVVVSQKSQRSIEKALLSFYKLVYKKVSNEFIYRNYTPSSVTVELVVEKGRFFWNSPKVSVLQYKPGLNKEIVLSLLSGMVSREDTDRRDAFYDKLQATDKVLRVDLVQRLGRSIPEFLRAYNNNEEPKSKRSIRYALLMEDGNPFFVFWDSGQLHAEMKMKLSRTKAKWFKSGYLKLKMVDGHPTLVFTETTIHDETDRQLLLSVSQQLFEKALKNDLAANEELRQILRAIRPKITFNTFEGGGTISLEE
jgi:hypothetical protein